MTFAGHNQAQWADPQARFTKAAFPKLWALADDVERLAERLVAQPFAYDQRDNADFMTLSFVAKQREHFESVRVLLSHGRDRDALLIARTMIEGMASLL